MPIATQIEESSLKEFFREKYILITPCKNEETNLQNLIRLILIQTIKPGFWVIVNDGSMDKTGEIIAEAEKKYGWIKGAYLKENTEYDVGIHLAHVYNKGFELAMNYCRKNNIKYEYIAVIDADNMPEPDYFKKLISKFKDNAKLGIASGNSVSFESNQITDISKIGDGTISEIYEKHKTNIQQGREDLPMGSARMWRKECFEDAGGGYPITKAPDSVAILKAKLRGWSTKRFMDIYVIERRGQSKQGLWEGYKEIGESNYYRGFPFHIALAKALFYSVKKPYYIGMAYLWGYIKSVINAKERISDDEVLKYYRYTRQKELKAHYKEKLKRRIRL